MQRLSVHYQIHFPGRGGYFELFVFGRCCEEETDDERMVRKLGGSIAASSFELLFQNRANE